MSQTFYEKQKKTCPFTGKECKHKNTCLNGKYVTECWARHAHVAGQPEGRETGLHRDSMG